jgi:pyruvate/2-oxoglutarate dehydrogenase complex dihydrolipoamide acyltransferase (E2) component
LSSGAPVAGLRWGLLGDDRKPVRFPRRQREKDNARNEQSKSLVKTVVGHYIVVPELQLLYSGYLMVVRGSRDGRLGARHLFVGWKTTTVANSGSSIKLTSIQKLIGERMLESERTKPCISVETEADMTELMTQRRRLSKSAGVKITSNAFLIRAIALAVKEYPLLVGTVDIETECVKIARHINVGFAVDAPQGLAMPVIKDADMKDLAEIARLEKSLMEKARSNQLTLEDLQGETIALSNLGAYGINSFVAIAPPQASAILAVGSVVQAVVPIEGKPTVRKMATLTLVVDGRIISGPSPVISIVNDCRAGPNMLK